jgi:hypothetical protein
MPLFYVNLVHCILLSCMFHSSVCVALTRGYGRMIFKSGVMHFFFLENNQLLYMYFQTLTEWAYSYNTSISLSNANLLCL